MDFVTADRVRIVDRADSRRQILELITDIYCDSISYLDKSHVFKGLFNREQLGSTACGGGIAAPHCRIRSIDAPLAAVLFVSEGTNGIAAKDNIPVKLFFSLLSPSFLSVEQVSQTLSEFVASATGESLIETLPGQSPDQIFACFGRM